jgi:hypothetical protein
MEEKIITTFLGLSAKELSMLTLAGIFLSMQFCLLIRERRLNENLVTKLLDAFKESTATNEKLQAAVDSLKEAVQRLGG